MNLLSNSVFQFIISSSLSIVLGGISIWLAMRRTNDGVPSYEGLDYEGINPVDPEVKQLLTDLQIPLDEKIRHFRFLTFKLWNARKEPIIIEDEKKPLLIAFEGMSILACQKLEAFPEDLDYTFHLEDRKPLLALPRLEKNESLTLRVLLPGYVNDFPDIRIRGRAPKPIMKANNIRRSKEMLIMGIIYLCATTYMFLTIRSLPPSPMQYPLWLFFAAGLLFLAMSWADRKMPPSQLMLPSIWFYILFMLLIRSLPILIPIGILALVVYLWFGGRVLGLLYLISVMIFIPLGGWYLGYSSIIAWLKRKQKKHNALIIGVLMAIPLVAFYALCASVIIDMLVR